MAIGEMYTEELVPEERKAVWRNGLEERKAIWKSNLSMTARKPT